MSLEDVKDEIISKAKKEAEKIEKEGEKEKLMIISEAKEKVSDYKKEKKAALKEELELMKKKVEASNELELKKTLLTEKKKIVNELMKNVISKISSLPPQDRKKIIDSLVKKANSEIKVEKIFCNKQDIEIAGEKAKEIGIKGGIVAENKDGSVSVDYSIETIVEDYKEKNIEKISNLLFN